MNFSFPRLESEKEQAVGLVNWIQYLKFSVGYRVPDIEYLNSVCALQANKDKAMFELEIKQLGMEVKRAKETKQGPQVDFALPPQRRLQHLGVFSCSSS